MSNPFTRLRVPSLLATLAAIAIALPMSALAAAPAITADAVTWTFSAAADGANGWTAERGRIAPEGNVLQLRPDTSRRAILVSPPALPAEVRDATAFRVAVDGTGLQRVRIQGRRDARGGWITLADASGSALRQTPEGAVVPRKAGVKEGSIERLRVELVFRTTNPRTLASVAALRR